MSTESPSRSSVTRHHTRAAGQPAIQVAQRQRRAATGSASPRARGRRWSPCRVSREVTVRLPARRRPRRRFVQRGLERVERAASSSLQRVQRRVREVLVPELEMVEGDPVLAARARAAARSRAGSSGRRCRSSASARRTTSARRSRPAPRRSAAPARSGRRRASARRAARGRRASPSTARCRSAASSSAGRRRCAKSPSDRQLAVPGRGVADVGDGGGLVIARHRASTSQAQSGTGSRAARAAGTGCARCSR